MTVSLSHQWNSWDQQDPLSMVHLPTGFCLRFSAFSSAEGNYRLLGVGSGVKMLEHTSDGGFIRARIAHADSEMELTFAKDHAHALSARLRMVRLGEWGLRFWLALEVGFLEHGGGPLPWRPDEPWIEVENAEPLPLRENPRLIGRHRSLWISVASRDPAVFGGAYETIETFRGDIQSQGYYAPPRAAKLGRWGVLRFNAQMHPEIVIAATFGTDREMAVEATDSLLSRASRLLDSATAAATKDTPPRQAVRDVVAWNTLWDPANHRPTTVLTRNWLTTKFSGWGVWLNDMLFHALLAALAGNWETARANLAAALEYQSPEGNLPCLRTATQEWIDRSQSPLGGYILWRIFELIGDRSLLALHFAPLLRAHRWWIEKRDGNADGLIEYGSSPTGTGAFVHTKQEAMDESFMDNAPIFDESGFDPGVHTLTMAEPGLNSLVSLDAQFLARIATELGDTATAIELRATAERLNARISERLWDPNRQVFAGRHWSGAFVGSLSAACFFPLIAGAATEAQASALIDRYLVNPEKFWGERVLPSSSHDDPASADDVYWRGRIWPPHLFLVWEGLRRHGRRDIATKLAERAWRMFETGWNEARICRENFHRIDPSGDDSRDADRFYTWGALIPAIRMLDTADLSPWEGRAFAPKAGEDATLVEPGAEWRATRLGESIHLALNGRLFLKAENASHVALPTATENTTRIEATPASAAAEVILSLYGIAEAGLRVCEIDGAAATPAFTENGFTLTIPSRRHSVIQLWHGGRSVEADPISGNHADD
jgi:putative isomerase